MAKSSAKSRKIRKSAAQLSRPTKADLARLRAAPWNANRVPAAILRKIRRSIEEFGVVENLVARPHPTEPDVFEVISGNHRLELLRELGVASAPVVVVELDDGHAPRARIALA